MASAPSTLAYVEGPFSSHLVPAKRGRDWSEVWADALDQYVPSLPSDFSQLVAIARNHMVDYDRAVLAQDPDLMLMAQACFKAAIVRANGDTISGCEAGPDASGPLLRQALAAAPGEQPIWGQKGEFLVDHCGIRAVLRTSGLNSIGGYELHAASKTGLFISPTGYRSLCGAAPIYGADVLEAAQHWIEGLLDDSRPVPVDAKHRKNPLLSFPWLVGADETAPSTYQDKGGQMAFCF